MRPSTAALLLTLCFWSASAFPGAAQEAHYWGNQFGNESVLLSGTVIGSVSDVGAVFYNPARLLHMEAPAFVVSAKLYEWSQVRVKDGLGRGADLESNSFGGAPGFLGGTFTIPFLEGHEFGYGLLTRNRGSFDYFVREERTGDLFAAGPADDVLVGFIGFERELKDDWFGLSWAYPLSERWSVGASAFFYNRSAGTSVDLDLRALDGTLSAGSFQAERSYRVRDRGFLAKLGVAWQGDRLSFGLSATTPYWSILNDGIIRYENFQTGLPDPDGGTFDNLLESVVQTDLPVRWKTPWSVGTGVGWRQGEWMFHAAAEYFAAVPAHTLVALDPVLGQSTSEPVELTVIEERDAVINGGIGTRWNPSQTFAAFLSVATNHSSAPEGTIGIVELEPVANHTNLKMDFILLGGGVSFSTGWADLTLGATWQASSESAPRLVDLPDEEEPEFDEGIATLKVDQWRFLFGFSFPLAEDLGATLGGDGNE